MTSFLSARAQHFEQLQLFSVLNLLNNKVSNKLKKIRFLCVREELLCLDFNDLNEIKLN